MRVSDVKAGVPFLRGSAAIHELLADLGEIMPVWVRVIPAKTLFRSTMIHEVVNRGDVFVVDLTTGLLTIIDGAEDVVVKISASFTVRDAPKKDVSTRKPRAPKSKKPSSKKVKAKQGELDLEPLEQVRGE